MLRNCNVSEPNASVSWTQLTVVVLCITVAYMKDQTQTRTVRMSDELGDRLAVAFDANGWTFSGGLRFLGLAFLESEAVRAAVRGYADLAIQGLAPSQEIGPDE